MKRIQIDSHISLDGSIVDFETTHWDVEEGELITAGFLSQDGIVILQRLAMPQDEFAERVREEMKNKMKPWYAFNKRFEESFCQLEIERDLQRVEHEAAFMALKTEDLLDHYSQLCDPIFNEEIESFWNAWKKTGNLVFLSKIVRHNYCCLAKEYYLKLRRIDNIPPNQIGILPSSASIEKRYIRGQLGFSVE